MKRLGDPTKLGALGLLLALAPTSACTPVAGSGGGLGLVGPGTTTNSRASAAPSTGAYAMMAPGTSALEREARLDARAREPINERVVTGLFWGGTIVGSIGAASVLGFGFAGGATDRRLSSGYQEGMTRAERDRLVAQGETFNAIAVSGAVLASVGLATAAISYTLDASRCGPMRRKRESCTPL